MCKKGKTQCHVDVQLLTCVVKKTSLNHSQGETAKLKLPILLTCAKTADKNIHTYIYTSTNTNMTRR